MRRIPEIGQRKASKTTCVGSNRKQLSADDAIDDVTRGVHSGGLGVT